MGSHSRASQVEALSSRVLASPRFSEVKVSNCLATRASSRSFALAALVAASAASSDRSACRLSRSTSRLASLANRSCIGHGAVNRGISREPKSDSAPSRA